MPPKTGRGRGKRLAGKYRTQKRKAEETEDLEVQEDSTESPTRERRRKSKKDVSPCPSKTPERSPEGSRYPQQSERSPQQSRRSPQQSQESRQHSPSPPPPRNRQPESSDDEDESASPTLPAGKSKSKPQVGKGKGDKGKGKAQNENPPPGAPYSFTKAQEEAIARWVVSKKLLYDMKDKQYKDIKEATMGGKCCGVRDDSIQKWYHTQRTRFSKLREGQPKKKSQKRSGDGVSSGDEEDPILAEETSENDSDRDKFIRRVFGFLKPHLRRYKKDTPASFKDKLALAETGELAGRDDSSMASSLANEPREPTKNYQKVSRQFRMREAAGDQISPLEDVPSAFQSQQPQQQRPVAVIPVCTSATYSRVSQLQQESALPSGTHYSASTAASSPSAEFQPGPRQWPMKPPPASVWRSQECGYVEQANQQYNVEQQQQQQYHTLQPASTSTIRATYLLLARLHLSNFLLSLLSSKSEVLGS
ncbi:thyroid hormone receptor-associated protein 3-like [Gigantopelta aegis]|uniref:thyroid hormone receptor-associated protein 3-like n=1 Tax=Gigantopelta aegis TaxID=1735272 RepID=UPI001B88AF4D|nr:thyroid hormone receptor-associated protein 3-like [Gigantopelta aegis]